MREIISYHKDFKTNKTIKINKQKPNSKIKGKVMIELFEDGDKVLESYTENIIPDPVYKELFLKFFTGAVMGVGIYDYNSLVDLYDYIYLTDSTSPETSNSEKILGNVIGFALRNTFYSGTSTTKGTINRNESILTNDGNKIKVNFVFDFPTHAANGTFESIYWGNSNLDTIHIGPPLIGRSTRDGDGLLYGSPSSETDVYWHLSYFTPGGRYRTFTDLTNGYILFDGTYSSAINSSYLVFPENLKDYQLMVPFDLSKKLHGLWSQAVKLLDDQGNAFQKNDVTAVIPKLDQDGNLESFLGFYISTSDSGTLRTFKWSQVGVLLETNELLTFQTIYKDEYGSNFVFVDYDIEPLYWGSPIEITGYHQRNDTDTGEIIYTNRQLEFTFDLSYVGSVDLKPKLGNSFWFETKGMNSGNIERRCRVNKVRYRTKSKKYIDYVGKNGGSSFIQVISAEGNLHITKPSMNNISTYTLINVIGTDKWVAMYLHYNNSSNNYYRRFGHFYGAPFKPPGAHTKLANPITKTDSNTMKIQYMFELDIMDIFEDRY